MNSRPRVYLAGPIAGLSYSEVMTWRHTAQSILGEHGIDVIMPVVYPHEGTYPMLAKDMKVDSLAVFHADLFGVAECDAVLAGFPLGNMASVGTAFEAGAAFAYRVPVYIWCPDVENLHPFLVHGATGGSTDLNNTVMAVVQYFTRRNNNERQLPLDLEFLGARA